MVNPELRAQIDNLPASHARGQAWRPNDRTDRSAAPGDDAPHLLVVDDDTRIRNLLKQYLTENGFRVTVAGNAAEARRKLEGLDFDLLVLDVMMPGENGVDLTKSLRAEKQVPILMLTALSETDSRIAGLEAGADDYLPKPFDPRELILRINNILRRGGPADGAEGRADRVRALHVPDRAARIEEGRRAAEAHRPRAGDPGDLRRARRRDDPAPRAGRRRRRKSASAPSTCRSTGCAARSSAIRPTRSGCRPCAVLAIG